MKNGIIILGRFFACPSAWQMLSEKQIKKVNRIIYQNTSSNVLKIKLLMVLLNVRWFTFIGIYFIFFMKAEILHSLFQLLDFMLKNSDCLIIDGKILKIPKQLSFIRFIKLDESLRSLASEYTDEALNTALAVVLEESTDEKYDDLLTEKRKNQLKNLHFEVKKSVFNAISKLYNEIIDKNHSIFNKKEGANISKESGNWFQVIRLMAGSPLHFESVAHLPLDIILFDIHERMKEAEKLETLNPKI